MIRLRAIDGEREVVEMAPDTRCLLIDGLHYTETKEVRTIGVMTTLQELRAFEMVQVDTGFCDEEQPRVMTILPKRRNGIAMLVAALAMSLLAGCGSGATYHYSYTCYGNGCAPPPPSFTFIHTQMPLQARVVYVDRPVELLVRRDGSVDTNQRRAALPRRRAQ